MTEAESSHEPMMKEINGELRRLRARYNHRQRRIKQIVARKEEVLPALPPQALWLNGRTIEETFLPSKTEKRGAKTGHDSAQRQKWANRTMDNVRKYGIVYLEELATAVTNAAWMEGHTAVIYRTTTYSEKSPNQDSIRFVTHQEIG